MKRRFLRSPFAGVAAITLLAGAWTAYEAGHSLFGGKPAKTAARTEAEEMEALIKAEADAREADKLRLQQAHPEALGKEGWTKTEEPPPDVRLVSLDPTLLPAREAEIQAQLESNIYRGKALDRVAEIARRTDQRKTRLLALDALADSDDERGQRLMTELYKDPRFDGEFREEILGHLRPTSLESEAGKLLIEEASNTRNPEAIQIQALAPLVVMTLLAEKGGPDPKLLGKLPAESRKKFMNLYQAMLSGEEPNLPQGWEDK